MFPFIMIVDREKWDNSLLTRFKTFLYYVSTKYTSSFLATTISPNGKSSGMSNRKLST